MDLSFHQNVKYLIRIEHAFRASYLNINTHRFAYTTLRTHRTLIKSVDEVKALYADRRLTVLNKHASCNDASIAIDALSSRVQQWRVLCMQQPSQWLLAGRLRLIEAYPLLCTVWLCLDVSVWFRLWWRSWRCSSGDEHPQEDSRPPCPYLPPNSPTREETLRLTFTGIWVLFWTGQWR